ncbi:sensor histidine kinase [Actinomadura chibensis]|uniref:Sensor histidine kinase n=2 Tax=Actinomadura chibensis TaxID=392828 RepID=A0A5D0NFZ8_9ACTN|nr:sensor histidine kinase [Actinomadura chibensis]
MFSAAGRPATRRSPSAGTAAGAPTAGAATAGSAGAQRRSWTRSHRSRSSGTRPHVVTKADSRTRSGSVSAPSIPATPSEMVIPAARSRSSISESGRPDHWRRRLSRARRSAGTRASSGCGTALGTANGVLPCTGTRVLVGIVAISCPLMANVRYAVFGKIKIHGVMRFGARHREGPAMPDSGAQLPPALRRSVETRVGTTFVLLMQLRVLVVGVTVLVDGQVRGDRWALGVLVLAVVVSGVALAGWEKVVLRLFEQPALLAFDVLIGYAVLRVGGIFGPYFLVTVVTAGLAGLLYRWQVTALLCAQQTVLYYTALYRNAPDDDGRVTMPLLLVLPVFYGVAALVGTVLRRLFDEHAAAEERRWRMEALAMAAEERTRLAREMHDSLTATLSGIALSATGLPAWVRKSPDRAAEEAARIATAAQVATREARSLIAELRDEAGGTPLAEAVRELADEWQGRTGVPVGVTAAPDADLPPPARRELVTIVREALENVRRHAEASRVEIATRAVADGVQVRVRDDGRGLPGRPDDPGWLDALARGGHYGLVGMHERAGRAGGRLAVASVPGGGTEITVLVPAAGADAEPARAELGSG